MHEKQHDDDRPIFEGPQECEQCPKTKDREKRSESHRQKSMNIVDRRQVVPHGNDLRRKEKEVCSVEIGCSDDSEGHSEHGDIVAARLLIRRAVFQRFSTSPLSVHCYTVTMTSYKDAGVDTEAGNAASQIAYNHAKKTFSSRSGKMGAPLSQDGGFAGLLDMGDFYLVQNDDGTGSKMELAVAMDRYDTLGYDLLAMVADDAICTGAEVISVSNTLDVAHVDSQMIDPLLAGLANACQEQNIVMPGGEIAEVPDAVTSSVWNATAIGIVSKDRVIDTGSIAEGDHIIAFRSGVARSNGFSLIRKVLADAHGDSWHSSEWKDGTTWGEVMLTPSIIYHDALLKLLGRYGEDRTVNVKGIAHITGGGIAENLKRTLKKSGSGAALTDLFAPHDAMKDLIALGSISTEEAYRTWNMGNGMLLVVSPEDSDQTTSLLQSSGIEAKVAGTVTADGTVTITAFDGTTL